MDFNDAPLKKQFYAQLYYLAWYEMMIKRCKAKTLLDPTQVEIVINKTLTTANCHIHRLIE